MKTIVLNSGNVTSNNTLVYNFPSGSATFKNNHIAVSKISIYYSWPSITAGTNNGLSYTWIDGTTVSVDPPTGYYTVSDLNAYLQSVMVTNDHYLIDSAGNYVYYLELIENSVYYAVQLNSYPVPTALPTGWSNPGVWSLPGTAETPQMTVGSISSILGITAGTYPSVVQSSNYSYLSDFTPQVTPVQSVLVTCNLVNNPLAIPSNVVY